MKQKSVLSLLYLGRSTAKPVRVRRTMKTSTARDQTGDAARLPRPPRELLAPVKSAIIRRENLCVFSVCGLAAREARDTSRYLVESRGKLFHLK